MVRLTFAEAIDGYIGWRTPSGDVGAARLRAEMLAEVRASFGRSLPDAQPGESEADALRRTFRDGAFRSPEDTATYFTQLGSLLIAQDVVDAVLERPAGRRRLVIAPSPGLAQVPWSSLRVGPDQVMLGELADVHLAVPESVSAQARPPHDGDGELVALDPVAPGLRPVLGADGDRERLDGRWLIDGSRDAASFLFVGHVSAAGTETASGESTTLHLTEPVTAGELMRLGWRAPHRVGFVGCGSGTDLRYPEPFGPALTAILCGAELVTGSVWTLPTAAALAEYAGDTGSRDPVREFADAIADAHRGPRPLRDLLDWQAERARAWYAHGHPADNPAVWASMAVFARN